MDAASPMNKSAASMGAVAISFWGRLVGSVRVKSVWKEALVAELEAMEWGLNLLFKFQQKK